MITKIVESTHRAEIGGDGMRTRSERAARAIKHVEWCGVNELSFD